MQLLFYHFSKWIGIPYLAIFLLGSCSGQNDTHEFSPPVSLEPFLTMNHYVCYKTSTIVSIDGELSEKDWLMAEWSEPFKDIEGDRMPAPDYQTRVKMMWDDNFLYIAAQLEEPHVWANLRQRDTIIFYDNDFEVFIDPDWDTHQYYEIELNAMNTVWDLMLVKPYRDGGPAINSWDIKGFKSAVMVDGTINDNKDIDEGWTVEMAIPFSVLLEGSDHIQKPASTQQWRINFSRVEWKTRIEGDSYVKLVNPESGKPYPESNWVWSPQGYINMHMPEFWGVIQFSESLIGTGVGEYVPNPDLAYYGYLRHVYYAEKNYFIQNGFYTGNISVLKLPEDLPAESLQQIILNSGGQCFTAEVMSQTTGYRISIDHEGRIEKFSGRKNNQD